MSNTEDLFPIPVYKNNDYKLSKKEIELINDIGSSGKMNEGNNWTSKERYMFDLCKELKSFKNYCQEQIDYYAHEILKVDKKQQFYITQSWVNVNTKNTFHHSHMHLNSLISAVYFVTGNSIPITFTKNPLNYLFPNWELTLTDYNKHNSCSWSTNNDQNTLLLFPSSLVHEVARNVTDEKRISISFNTFIKGVIGSSDRLTELKL